jgi:dTDP-glucose 4,6-dehydratase
MRPHDGRAIPTFLRQALSDRPITIFGDGSQTRSFTYVDDLVAGIIALAESGEHDPVNIGNPDEYTLLQLAGGGHRGHRRELGARLRGAAGRRPQGAPARHHAARELLGWEPKVPLHDGLRRTIDQAGVDMLIGP